MLPALAVAEALVDAGHPPEEIRYIGARRGIETRLLPDTPFPATFLDVVGFQRRLTAANVGFVPKMVRSARVVVRSFREQRPRVVVSVGGYASLPAVLAAQRLGVPVVVVSYDRRPGRASALAARRAAACAVAFDGSPLPRAEVTGAPVRRAILDVDRADGRAAARTALDLPQDRFVVGVMGGSLGSGVLNDTIARYVRAHADDAGLAVRQIAGERFAADVAPVEAGASRVLHQVVGFEPRMDALYAAVDLLVGRGGASTVHEVAVTGTPAILVPWSGAAEDHQTDNVRWLADDGAAVLLPETAIGELEREIERLRHDAAARQALAVAARARGEVHRSGALALLVERVAVTSGGS